MVGNKIRRYVTAVLLLSVAMILDSALVLANESSGQDTPPATRLQLDSYEIHRVQLEKPRTIVDATGTQMVVEEAFLILLQLEQPPFWGPRVDLFIGDYQVPEYGGWDDGLYFRIYDRVLLQRLSGSEMRYRIAGGRLQSFDMVFEISESSELPLRSERQLLKGAK